MTEICNVLCMTQCLDLSFNNETLDALWTCLTFLCNVTVEDHQRTSFLSYLATNVSVDMNASSYSNCATEGEVFLLETVAGYAIPVKGYISPVFILLTIINNTLVCIVLLKPHMRSPVNVILVFIALSDILTFVFLAPVYIYFYASERVHEWIPYNWCYAIRVLEYSIPNIFIIASMWLTTVLAIQQYVCVCHPFKAQTWCTMRNIIYSISAIYLFATVITIPSFFNIYIIETRRRSRINPSFMVSACIINMNPWFVANLLIYDIYYYFTLIFNTIIPCVSLIVLNTLLILAMRKAMRERNELLRQNKTSEFKQLKETNSTTMMLVTVMMCLLLLGTDTAVYTTLYIIQDNFEINIFTQETHHMYNLFSNFCLTLSRPINFFIYCSMSTKFRDTFKRLFTCRELP